MTVTAGVAQAGIPLYSDDMYVAVNASGTALIINPGDYVLLSAFGGQAAAIGSAAAKASGLGIALDRNPAFDAAGRQVVNSALLVATRGIFRVSASFSGHPLHGVLAYSDATGSAVNAASGVTGVGATWNTAAPSNISANPTGAPNLGVAQVVGWTTGAGGTGQLDIRLWPRNADYY